MSKYDLGGDSSDDIHKKIEKEVDAIEKKTIDDIKQLDELNPMEQAQKFEEVKKNPPLKDYMKVDTYSGMKTKTGEPVVVSISHGPAGTEEEKIILHDPIMSVDLNTSVKADIAACPSNVVPMIIDERLQLAADEKKEYKPEKRKPEFNWGWILILFLLVPAIAIVILFFFG